MEKRKKITGIILSIILIISISTTIFIATANTKNVTVTITSDKQELAPGESATVSVKVTSNCNIATMAIPVFYDKNLVEVSDATATLTNYAVKNATTDAESVDSAKVYANTGISADDFGFVLVNYIGSAGSDLGESVDSVVLTFKITAKADVLGTAVLKCVKESAKTTDNVAGMLYFGSIPSGLTIDAIPENIENVNLTSAETSVKISSGANTLTLNENAPFEAIIDTTNCGDYTGVVYGFDTLGWNDTWEVDGTIADFLSTAYGDDYLEVIVPEDAGVETTGTLINVLDENSEVVETYVYIYFGDIDMDGAVGSSDAFFADNYEMNYEGIETLYQFIAGDVDGDGVPGSSDAFFMDNYEMNYEGMPLQSDMGAVVYGSIVYEIF